MMDAHAGSAWLPETLYKSMSRTLKPLESAVRRLILIAAEKLELPAITAPATGRKWPEGLIIQRPVESRRRTPFRLFDPRRTFSEWGPDAGQDFNRPIASLCFIGSDPRIPGFLRGEPAPVVRNPPAYGGLLSIRMISTRLSAVAYALRHIPSEVRRLKRALARNGSKAPEKRRFVLRPGAPPGGRKQPVEEVDEILKECHALARHAVSLNTS